MAHFLQGPAWATFQGTLGRTVVSDQGEGWEYHAFLEQGKLGKRLYAPYGPVATHQASLKQAIDSLAKQGKKLGASYIRVEPTGSTEALDFPSLGLQRVKRKQPEHTQRVQLARPFDEVLREMQSSLRNRHRNYAKKGMSVRKSQDPSDVEHLIRILNDVAQRTGMDGHDPDYLRATAQALLPLDAGAMYMVDFEGQVIAASLVFDDADCRYYAHAAADNEHRKLQPGPILVTQMIEDANDSGQQWFDLYGVVPPEVTDHPWSGFSTFKRSFGGEQVDYAGTWEMPLKPLQYRMYQLVHRVMEK